MNRQNLSIGLLLFTLVTYITFSLLCLPVNANDPPSGSITITPVTQFSSDLEITVQNLDGANYYSVYRKGVKIGSCTPITDKLRSMPQVFSDPSLLDIRFYDEANETNLKGFATINNDYTLKFIIPANTASPTGSYSITPITQLSSDFSVSIDDLAKANYMALYHQGTLVGSIVRIDQPIRTIPQMLSDVSILEVKFYEDNEGLNQVGFAVPDNNGRLQFNKDGCFIATAAYGSKFEPHVAILRQFRDQYLMKHEWGRTFVKLYYHYSPPIALAIGKSEISRFCVRAILYPLVGIAFLIIRQKVWYLTLLLLALLTWLFFHKKKPVKLAIFTLLILAIGIGSVSVSGAAIADVENNSLRIGNDIYSLASDNLTNDNITASLGINNIVYFKIGDHWYDVFAAAKDSDLGDITKAVAPEIVNGWTGLKKWYQAGAAVVSLYVVGTPTGFKVSSVGSNYAILGWNQQGGASAYKVYRSDNEGGPYVLVGSTGDNTYKDSGLSLNKTYWYKLSGTNGNSEGAMCAPISACTLTKLPGIPILAGNVVGNLQINLSWNEVLGADYYRVYYADINIWSPSYTPTPYQIYVPSYRDTTTTTFSLQRVPLITLYCRVCAVNACGMGNMSNIVEVKTGPDVPNESFTQFNVSPEYYGIKVSWSSVKFASYYNVYRCDSQTGIFDLISTTTSLEYFDTAMEAGKIYWYQVSAVNGAGEGSPCIPCGASIMDTSIGVPENVTSEVVTSSGKYNVKLAWPEVNNATSYNIYRSNLKNGPYTLISTVTSNNLIDDKDLTAKTDYWYMVTAIKNNQEGTPSVPIRTTTGSVAQAQLELAYYWLPKEDWVNVKLFSTNALNDDPNCANAYNYRSMANVKTFCYSEGLADAEKAVELLPNSPLSYFNRACAYEGLKYLDEAKANYEKVITMTADNYLEYFARGYAKSKLGDYAGAMIEFSSCSATQPDFQWAMVQRGWCYYYLEDYNSAAVYFNRTSSSYMDSRIGLGWVYYQFHDYQYAINYFSSVINLDYDNKDAYYGRSEAYYKWGQYQACLNDLTVISQLDPQDPIAPYNMGELNLILSNYTDAITCFSRVLALDSTIIDAYSERGCAYYYSEQYNLAIQDFNTALSSVLPGSDDAINLYEWLGWSYLAQDNYQQAENQFNQALSIQRVYTSLGGRGWVYYYWGKYAEARADFNEALTLNPSYQDAIDGISALDEITNSYTEGANFSKNTSYRLRNQIDIKPSLKTLNQN